MRGLMTLENVARLAKEAEVRLVRFLYCDNGGVIRGKSTHLRINSPWPVAWNLADTNRSTRVPVPARLG